MIDQFDLDVYHVAVCVYSVVIIGITVWFYFSDTGRRLK